MSKIKIFKPALITSIGILVFILNYLFSVFGMQQFISNVFPMIGAVIISFGTIWFIIDLVRRGK